MSAADSFLVSRTSLRFLVGYCGRLYNPLGVCIAETGDWYAELSAGQKVSSTGSGEPRLFQATGLQDEKAQPVFDGSLMLVRDPFDDRDGYVPRVVVVDNQGEWGAWVPDDPGPNPRREWVPLAALLEEGEVVDGHSYTTPEADYYTPPPRAAAR
ncbi:MAG: hypothetical protein AAFQ43_00905 [Bacteroidota bacterium]